MMIILRFAVLSIDVDHCSVLSVDAHSEDDTNDDHYVMEGQL